MRDIVLTHRKKVVIVAAVTILDMLFGFDAKFTIINMVWLFV